MLTALAEWCMEWRKPQITWILVVTWNLQSSWGGKMPGLCLASWKHTSKVMGGLFASWGPDDWLGKTSNSEETNPGGDSSDTGEATNNYGCEQLWKGTEIQETLWVWKWEHCGQEETLHRNQRKIQSSLDTCTHTSESVCHTSRGSMI